MTQPEEVLEKNLVAQLVTLKYEEVEIADEAMLLANLQRQLEKHNDIRLSEKEFERVLNHLNKGNIFQRAKILRDKMTLHRDDGTATHIEFLNLEHWCQNEFQVTRQVSIKGKYSNRYDVTLLINGLPLVQIELKRRGLELKEAFNQVNRYQRHSFWAAYGLFRYVQLFVISNGVNTKYYANNPGQSFKQTFFWTDTDNRKIAQLEAFAQHFLEPCHLSKMICKYTVLHETDKILMVLRPYQFYATEAIINRVKHSTKNGYIWHTTGSGKTLTSFKAAQILMRLKEVYKVVFVVDRKDLDYQTAKEFNAFSQGCVDETKHTESLVKQLEGAHSLIVTTIQKLNNAVERKQYLHRMNPLRDKPLVFIFDECHRSQFGDTHQRIVDFFEQAQLFGFTGTPIFAENAVKNARGKRTTKELFDECLHKYVITDAIRDENVLKFSVEYVGRYKQREGSRTEIDIPVEGINTREALENPERLEKIAHYIAANFNRKTHNGQFTAMFCVSSVEAVITYYDIFQRLKAEGKHSLSIATIFSYGTNEDDKDADGMIKEVDFDIATHSVNVHTRDKMDAIIEDYNAMFQTRYSTRDSQSFYSYYKDISKRVRNQQIHLLLVVNMFLTGFDSKTLNTLFVDKNLRYHGLIQAYSRTNRILNEVKSQGNIVAFRNLKEATDEAIALFANKDANEVIFLEPYEAYVEKFNAAVAEMKALVPTVDSVDDLPHEDAEFAFVKAFRALMRLKNTLEGFTDFDFVDLAIEEQEFVDYKTKYLDIHHKVRSATEKEKVSILNDVDFELELIHRDEVNVVYILGLLARMHGATQEEKARQHKQIVDMLAGEVQMHSKRELIELFIEESLPAIADPADIPEAFERFWDIQREKAFAQLCKEEGLEPARLQEVVNKYLFTERDPLGDDIVNALEVKPGLLQRRAIIDRVRERILTFVETFIAGLTS